MIHPQLVQREPDEFSRLRITRQASIANAERREMLAAQIAQDRALMEAHLATAERLESDILANEATMTILEGQAQELPTPEECTRQLLELREATA